MGRRKESPSDSAQPNFVVTRHGEYVPTDEFEGPKLKIERAKRHIADFREAFSALSHSNIMRFEPYVDPETGDDSFKIWQSEPLPSDLRLTAADAIYNLRAALDQAACSCARLAGEPPDGTYFPHGSNKARFEISLREKCQKVPEPVRSAIAALEPYDGGNGYLLRVLHDLNIVDKHRDLIAVGVSLRKLTVTPGQGGLPTGTVWHRGEDKFEVTNPLVLKAHHDVKITLAVTFTDVKAIEGESVTQVLNQACDLVSRTVLIMEKAMVFYKISGL
jgi:hypothetical protein